MTRPLVRTSERTTFTRCLKSWEWAYVDCLAPKTAAPPLRFGTLIHKALEKRYPPGIKRGPHPAQTFEQLYEEELKTQHEYGFKDEDGTWHDALELGVEMMNNYVERFGEDDEWEVIASEQVFRVPIKIGGKVACYAVGTFDGVWRYRPNLRLFLNDYKTAKSIQTGHLLLDEQNGSYWAFAPWWLRKQGIIGPKEDLEGIVYTFLRKAAKDKRPQNADGLYLNKPTVKELKEHGPDYPGSVSKVQPPPLFHREVTYRTPNDRAALIERFKLQFLRMQYLRENRDEIYKEPGRNSCSMCSMRDMCELHEVGADWESFRDSVMKTWDPYADHEIYDEGKH